MDNATQSWLKLRRRNLSHAAVRRRILFVAAVFPAAIFAGALIPAVSYAAAAPDSATKSVLLGSSQEVRREFDRQNVRRVARAFADLKVGSQRTTVSQEDLQMMLGPEDPAVAGSGDTQSAPGEKQLATVEIETRVPPGIQESAVQAPIPYGFEGMLWGVRHPTQAWRLVMPVLGSGTE